VLLGFWVASDLGEEGFYAGQDDETLFALGSEEFCVW